MQNNQLYPLCHSRENGNPIEMKICGFPIRLGMTPECYFAELVIN